jgi:hypothetical protein
VQPDQGEQAEDFGLGGPPRGQQSGQPLGIVGQVPPLWGIAGAAHRADLYRPSPGPRHRHSQRLVQVGHLDLGVATDAFLTPR